MYDLGDPPESAWSLAPQRGRVVWSLRELWGAMRELEGVIGSHEPADVDHSR